MPCGYLIGIASQNNDTPAPCNNTITLIVAQNAPRYMSGTQNEKIQAFDYLYQPLKLRWHGESDAEAGLGLHVNRGSSGAMTEPNPTTR